jgi:hypothetical protein
MDIQAVGVALAGVITAFGAVVTGIYTGKSGRRKDENEARTHLENFRLQREAAEEAASKGRIEAIAADAAEARKRLREVEMEVDLQLREARTYAQRGWDLARYHFGMLASVAHLLNNILTVEGMGGSPESLQSSVQNAKRRMDSLGPLPVSLEDPLDNVLKRSQK